MKQGRNTYAIPHLSTHILTIQIMSSWLALYKLASTAFFQIAESNHEGTLTSFLAVKIKYDSIKALQIIY